MDTPKFQRKVKEIANDEALLIQAQNFLEELAENLPQMQVKARRYSDLAASGIRSSHQELPTAVLEALSGLRADSLVFLNGITALKLLIICRTPEIKEEDNAGVMVQCAFADFCDSVCGSISGTASGGGGDKKSSGPAMPLALSLKKEYLAARAPVEEKLAGEGKDAQPSKAPSMLEQLSQIDLDALQRVSYGYSRLYEVGMATLVGFARNAKKILEPRRSGGTMIG